MKWAVRIRPRLRLTAAKELGHRIDHDRIYARHLPTRDTYTSCRMATTYPTRREAELDIEYWFEEAVRVN